ncbi:putative CCR4-NOT transcription complex subunit 3 [Hypsibius exemplaris]|uniref:CCR4-NOT transcription complex subunit 3 n=1 Tax=Hypsibius exemplaris TaxID=2072580 RepID=A0A1W0WD46_HYPEX|nr:putative CCR4-NOT transcription complex subunit 3 [Hypsibius exemplaris]
MSDKRKLHCEMDRTFKKIQEGLEVFDLTWVALLEADTFKVREKYEEEVNNQIKKLQRLRDLVRGWIADGGVKDKEPLHKARRDVETRMEKLREYERESKTKEYSRAGLAQDKVDPEQKCRSEARQFLSDSIGQLNCGIEQFESELEALDGGGNRKKVERDKQDKLSFLEKGLLSHQSHLAKFEAMLRMLDNETLSPKTVFSLKDEFEYYMDQAADGQLREVDHDTMYYGIEFENEQGDIRIQTPEQNLNPLSITSDGRPDVRDAVVPENATVGAATPATKSSASALKTVQDSVTAPATSVSSVWKKPPPPPLTLTPVLELQQNLKLPKALHSTGTRSYANSVGGTGRTIRRSTSKKLAGVKDDSRSPINTTANGINGFLPAHTSSGGTAAQRRKSFAELLALQSTPKVKQPVPPKVSPAAAPSVRHAVMVTSTVNGFPNGTITNIPATTAVSPRSLAGGQVNGNRKPWNAWDDAEVKEGEPSAKAVRVETPSPSPSLSTRMVHAQPPQTASVSVSEDVVTEAAAYSALTKTLTAAGEATFDRGDGGCDGMEDRPSQRPLEFENCVAPVAISGSRLFSDLSTAEPNSTELIWKSPAPVLDWPEAASSVSDSVSGITFLASNNTSSSNAMTDLVGWQPPAAFGAEEFFGNNFKLPPLVAPPSPQRRNPGTAVFECDIHYKLATEVLFYVFYFQGDKLARIHAARDLELRNWSFYTKLSVWMQRMDFPRLQTTEYERGNFRYWDKDNWKEEKLSDFLVDYRYVKNPSEELMRHIA